MPKIDLDAIDAVERTNYPPEYAAGVKGRMVRRMTAMLGLQDFGVSHVTLRPGAWSSQRHWHEREDELVVMLTGEAVLVDDAGRIQMRAGDMAVFPKNDGNGHHLRNESDRDCVFVAIGLPPEGPCHYPDIDMLYQAGGYTRKDGSSFA